MQNTSTGNDNKKKRCDWVKKNITFVNILNKHVKMLIRMFINQE